jgi:PadR family transcriptional regulator PadR
MSATYNGVKMEPLHDLELTPKMADVVKVFLEDPQRERYGFELMRITGQGSGAIYPNLAKLQRAGWLTVGKEDIDPRLAGRPARRFYRITGAAVSVARVQLAALSARYRPPTAAPRLAPGGATL